MAEASPAGFLHLAGAIREAIVWQAAGQRNPETTGAGFALGSQLLRQSAFSSSTSEVRTARPRIEPILVWKYQRPQNRIAAEGMMGTAGRGNLS